MCGSTGAVIDISDADADNWTTSVTSCESEVSGAQAPCVRKNTTAVTSSAVMPARSKSAWCSITARPAQVNRALVTGTVATINRSRRAIPRPAMTKARRPASREEIGALSGATRTTDAGFTPELTLGEGFAGPGFGRLCLCRCSNAFRCAGLEA
jgi:hypothetical protein